MSMDESKNGSALVTLSESGPPVLAWKAIFQTPVEEMSADQIAAAFGLLDVISKSTGARVAELKALIRKRVLADGKAATELTKRLNLGDLGTIDVTESKPSPVLNEAALKALLKEKELKLDTCFDQVWVLNEKSLKRLVASGEISAAELVACTTPGKPKAAAVKVKTHPFGLTGKALLS